MRRYVIYIRFRASLQQRINIISRVTPPVAGHHPVVGHCRLRTSKTHARKTCTCVLDVRYHNCSIVGPLTLLVSFSITTPFEEPDCSSVLKFGVVPLLYFTTSKKVGVLLEIENNAGDHVKMNKFSTKKYNGVR